MLDAVGTGIAGVGFRLVIMVPESWPGSEGPLVLSAGPLFSVGIKLDEGHDVDYSRVWAQISLWGSRGRWGMGGWW